MTENEKNLRDLEEWFKMNPTEGAAYEFQKKQLEEEMARESGQAQAASGGTSPIQQEATQVPPPDTGAENKRREEAEAARRKAEHEAELRRVQQEADRKVAEAESAARAAKKAAEAEAEARRRAEAYTPAPSASTGGMSAEELTNQGVDAYEAGNYAKAVELYRKAAEMGLREAQANLASCYKDGNGVPKDMAKAVEWYRKAAAQGNAEAQKWLAYLKEKEKNLRDLEELYKLGMVDAEVYAFEKKRLE